MMRKVIADTASAKHRQPRVSPFSLTSPTTLLNASASICKAREHDIAIALEEQPAIPQQGLTNRGWSREYLQACGPIKQAPDKTNPHLVASGHEDSGSGLDLESQT